MDEKLWKTKVYIYFAAVTVVVAMGGFYALLNATYCAGVSEIRF